MLLPIGRDTRGIQTTPAIVYLLILANIIVFLVELTAGEDFIAGYSMTPYEITHGVDLAYPVSIRGVGVIPQAPGPAPIYLTLITAMFMHSGFLHIAGNMLYLWIFGGEIEANFGHLRFLAFYLVCGIAAAVAQIWMDPDSLIPSLGASGAIAGVLGAYILMFPLNQIRALLPVVFVLVPVRLPALAVIGFWIVFQFFDEFFEIIDHNAQTRNGGIAYMAHIGGFLMGMALSLFLRRNDRFHFPLTGEGLQHKRSKG
jgi:rhomboid family protein